jgi:hypothetical protein
MDRTMSIALEEGAVLEFEQDGRWITNDSPQPDPNWRGVDSNGHEHYYAAGDDRYPTLVLVAGEPYYCPDCNDEHQDTWYECRTCGEKVEPGTRIDPTPKWIAGEMQYTLDGEPISTERANEILTEMRRRADEAAKITTRPSIGTRVRFGDATVTVAPTPDEASADEVTVMHDGSGTMETVPLHQLRSTRV